MFINLFCHICRVRNGIIVISYQSANAVGKEMKEKLKIVAYIRMRLTTYRYLSAVLMLAKCTIEVRMKGC